MTDEVSNLIAAGIAVVIFSIVLWLGYAYVGQWLWDKYEE